MKKMIIFMMLACLLTSFAFAAERFTVQSVKGTVEKVSGGAVKTGDVLSGDTAIRTGVGASVVLLDAEGKSITISAAKNGKVAELAKAAVGVRIGGNVVRTDTDAVSRTTGQVGTASARASDQAGGDDIAAE
ncbi:MAG: hypothetical protein FWF38_00545 [Spirochaetaceae bacterium]|nr:hypothetical protein [Spirochaetaceae bacterium]